MPKRILVVATRLYIGDAVMSQSLYKLIKKQRDDVEIDVLVPRFLHPLYERMPEVNQAIDIPAMEHGQLGFSIRRRAGLRLRGRYDQAIVLHRSWKKALVPWFAKIPVRTGYNTELRFMLLNDLRKYDRAALPRFVDQYIHLGQAPHTPHIQYQFSLAPKLEVDSANAKACMQRLGLDNRVPVLALVPSASYAKDPTRVWPYYYFSKVANDYGARGWQIWIFGSKHDRHISERIAMTAEVPVHNLCGKTELADAVDLLSQARLAVSNDSGLLHVATAVGCPVVAIYGSSSPVRTPPLSKNAKILWRGLCCDSGRYTCRDGHYRCLTRITPAEVIAAADSLISHSSSELKQEPLLVAS